MQRCQDSEGHLPFCCQSYGDPQFTDKVSSGMQILEQQHQLSFHLQQQRLIELIRQGKAEEALEHAQEYLAPPGEEDPAFLEELGMPGTALNAGTYKL